MVKLFVWLSIFSSIVWATQFRQDGFIRGKATSDAIHAIGEFVGHLSSIGFFHSDSGPSDLVRINPRGKSISGFRYKVSEPKDHGYLHSSVCIEATDEKQIAHYFILRVQYELSESSLVKYEIADIWFEFNKSERL